VNKQRLDFLKSIEQKWQKKWSEAKIFEADPFDKPKFFITFPYPYVNAYPHLGSAYTVLRVDITARYKRMKGYNVLFPQGWHATGSPIVASALRVRERDPKIINTLRMMGIPEDEIPKFEKPEYWVKFFTKAWRDDFKRYGLSIDWRREFYTTFLNPPYSKFIEWQYRKLKEKNLIVKGKHPVVWCPKEQKVVGDHDRPDEYVGIGPEKVIIIKFKDADGIVYPCMTYRPETVYGAVNIWINPEGQYVLAAVDGEKWVISPYLINELKDQYHKVETIKTVNGKELIGKRVINPVTKEEILVLPAKFVNLKIGTGVVMSVPAHAPYDYAALEDLKNNPEQVEKYGLEIAKIKSIKPVSLIKLEGYGDYPAIEIVKKMNIKSQEETEKLEKATKEIYTKEYHQGILKSVYGKWAGKKVFEVKKELVDYLVRQGIALEHWTLPSEVYCRCRAKTHVKIVENQWFLKYSDQSWKQKAHKCIDSMNFLPESIRDFFHKQIDWYEDWACAHKGELGTPLPWDKEWVLESLSDSTIYMAYYTISKYLQHPEKYNIKWEKLNDEFFDYIFFGKGDPAKIAEAVSIDTKLLEAMRKEFLYWYPVDLRISGKDLMPNHLTFFILHHVALFPREHWPRGIGINGWIMVGGQKMSKALGNFIMLRQALDWWGADATRFAEAYAGDSGLDDANFETEIAERAVDLLYEWYVFALENYGKGRNSRMEVDRWFESVLYRTVKEVEQLMERTDFKSALVKGFFNLQNNFKWYLKRCNGSPNKDLLARFIEIQTLLLAPFTPHICEEIWEKIGKKGFISMAEWPKIDEDKINPEVEKSEEIVKNLLEDAKSLLAILKVKPEKMIVVLADKWKYEVAENVLRYMSQGYSLRDSVRKAIETSHMVDKKKVARVAMRFLKDQKILTMTVDPELEERAIREAREFLSKEIGLQVEIFNERECSESKAAQALPAKPAIIFK